MTTRSRESNIPNSFFFMGSLLSFLLIFDYTRKSRYIQQARKERTLYFLSLFTRKRFCVYPEPIREHAPEFSSACSSLMTWILAVSCHGTAATARAATAFSFLLRPDHGGNDCPCDQCQNRKHHNVPHMGNDPITHTLTLQSSPECRHTYSSGPPDKSVQPALPGPKW